MSLLNVIPLSSILLILFFLLIEAFFSGSELALLSADRLILKKKNKQGHSGAKLALKLLLNPDKILSTTLLMTSTCVMATTVLLTLEFRSAFGEHGESKAIVLGSFLVITFGELLPKFFFRKFSEQLAPKVATPIFYTQKILLPFISLISVYTAQLSKTIQPIERFWSGKKGTLKEDLNVLLTSDAHETQIKKSEKTLIRKILKFRDRRAKDAIVPLIQVDAIEKSMSLYDAYQIFAEKHHAKIPVYEERIDNIIGILELHTIIRTHDSSQPVSRFLKSAYYISENQKLENVLNEMIEDEIQMAIVVDEHGGALGILTREDIFEQIVGDIEDEDDLERRSIRELDVNKWVVRASTTVQKINEELQLEIPEGDYDTVSGFLLRQFSRIPEPGDELYFNTQYGQLHLVIRDANPRKIESVLIEKIETP